MSEINSDPKFECRTIPYKLTPFTPLIMSFYNSILHRCQVSTYYFVEVICICLLQMVRKYLLIYSNLHGLYAFYPIQNPRYDISTNLIPNLSYLEPCRLQHV